MPKRKGRVKTVEISEEHSNSDSQIDYSFTEENTFVPRIRISNSPLLTRSRARIRAAALLESGIIMVNNDDENRQGASGVSNQGASASGPSELLYMEDLASRLERVLTMNHNAFMGEISNLRQTLAEGLGRNQGGVNNATLGNFGLPVGGNANQRNDDSFHDRSMNSGTSRSSSSTSMKIDKWNISYDGSQDISEFLFKVDTLKARWNYTDEQVNASFHTFLKGKAETWFWSYLKQYPNSRYADLKLAIKKQFGRVENDCDKLVKIIERRQMPKESFDDFFTEMMAMNARLSQPMNDNKMIDLIKNNVKESLGSLLFATDLFSLDHLRDSARRAEKYISRQQHVKSQRRFVSEVEMPENIDEVSEDEGEIAAFKYQGNQNRDRREIDTRKFKCWNCDQMGHSFYDCPSEKRNIFCYRCGEKNINTPDCKKHPKNKNVNE